MIQSAVSVTFYILYRVTGRQTSIVGWIECPEQILAIPIRYAKDRIMISWHIGRNRIDPDRVLWLDGSNRHLQYFCPFWTLEWSKVHYTNAVIYGS